MGAVGPLIATQILNVTGQTRYVYLIRSAFALSEFVHDWYLLKESLPPAKRVPFSGLRNPLAFLRIFRGPKTMVKLCWATFMTCWSEGKNTNGAHPRSYNI